MNKSLKVISFSYVDLSEFAFSLINLIAKNQVITVLNLDNCGIDITLGFMEGIISSKSLKYLDLSGNKIKEEVISLFSKLNLKGINLENAGISKSDEEIIYAKIPKIDYTFDLLEYEKFLS